MQPNVDAAEIDRFNALAARWWDENGECAALHKINPLRLAFIQQHSPLTDQRVLDVGCGGGILAEAMALAGAEVTAIDMAEMSLEVARQHARTSGVEPTYRRVTAEQLAVEAPGQWDVVTCMEMLEHVPDPAAVVTACGQLVKPGGWVHFSTINRNPKSFLFAIIGAEYVLNLLPRGTHRYENFIRPSELERWAGQAGLAGQDLTGIHYQPLTAAYSLAPGVDVNYLMATNRRGE